MKKINFFYLLFLLQGLSSCSNSLEKKECDNQNWQNYGKNTALKGEELSDNKFYKSCIELEVGVNTTMAELGFESGKKTYCTASQVKKLAEKGQFFNFSFCQFSDEDKMRELHSSGVASYCTRKNAYELGLQGKFYNQICPKHLEVNFSKNFELGRRQRLFSEIKNKQFEIDKIDLEISSLRLQQGEVTRNLLALPAVLPGKKTKLDLSRFIPSGQNSLTQRRVELSQSLQQLQDKILQLKKENAARKIKIKVLEKEILQ